MLRGFIVESGPVETVDRPLHPYTQLLKESIPQPTPLQRGVWAAHIDLGTTEVKEYCRIGCKFGWPLPARDGHLP